MRDIVLDLDGVCADFEGAFCKKFGWDNREFVKLERRYPECEEEIGWFSQASKTYRDLEVMDVGARIARFCENEKMDIHVVTSRPIYTTQTTGEWLKVNKIPFKYLSVTNGVKLGIIERINPLFIVDDLLNVVEPCASVGIPSFLIDHPWNQKEDLDGIIYRISSFDEFLAKYTAYFDF